MHELTKNDAISLKIFNKMFYRGIKNLSVPLGHKVGHIFFPTSN